MRRLTPWLALALVTLLSIESLSTTGAQSPDAAPAERESTSASEPDQPAAPANATADEPVESPAPVDAPAVTPDDSPQPLFLEELPSALPNRDAPMLDTGPIEPGLGNLPSPGVTSGLEFPMHSGEHDEPLPHEEPRETRPFQSAREFLSSRDVDESHLGFVVDGRPIDPEERETLFRVLARIPQITPLNFHYWRRELDWRQLDEHSVEQRLEAFRLPLRVRQIDAFPMPRELAERFNFGSYFQVQAEVAGAGGGRVFLFTRSVPSYWEKELLGQPIDEPASADALFFKRGEVGENQPAPYYFIAGSVAWHPDRPQPEAGITPALVELARHGLDVSQMAEVRDRAPFGSFDNEAFYQTLAAMRQVPPAWIATHAPERSPFPPLLTAPAQQRGQLTTIRGHLRRVNKIMVTDPAKTRFGMDHYFELAIFVDEAVRIESPDDPQRMVEFTSYPIFVCLPQLPPEIAESSTEVDEQMVVHGVYFKLWAYQSQAMQQAHAGGANPAGRQFSPLIIAQSARVIPRPEFAPNHWVIGTVAGLVIVLLLVGFINAWAAAPGPVKHQPAGPIGPPKE